MLGLTQSADAAPGREERLLSGVFCIGGVAEDGVGRPEHGVHLNANEGVESVTITGAGALDKMAHPPSWLLSVLMRDMALRFIGGTS